MKNLKEKLDDLFDKDKSEPWLHREPTPEELLEEEQPEDEEKLDSDEDHSENLPSVVTLPALPPPVLITPESTEKEQQAADLDLTNNNLQIIHQAWKTKRMTIRDACLLIDKTHATIEHRRKSLNRQYGYQSDGTKGGKIPDLD